MAVTPNEFVSPQSVKTAQAVCTAAKTTFNDGTNAVQLLPALTNGGIGYKLTAVPRATVTATMLQLYRYDGTNYFLIATALMSAHTVSNTTAIPQTDFGFSETNPLRIDPTDQLYVGASVALAGGIVFDLQYEEL